jgi:Holliday junction DNA helicase RuvB
MEDFRLDLVVPGLDGKPKAYPVPLNPFTLVGATTRRGMLTGALRTRFGLDFTITFYDVASLAHIVTNSATVLGMRMAPVAARELALRARGTPRIANRLLKRVRDHAAVETGSLSDVIDVAIVRKAMDLEGVDANGMDELDRRYLQVLIDQYRGGPVGVRAIAATMQEDADTLEESVEPFLLHQGYLLRTQTGRKATEKALVAIRNK